MLPPEFTYVPGTLFAQAGPAPSPSTSWPVPRSPWRATTAEPSRSTRPSTTRSPPLACLRSPATRSTCSTGPPRPTFPQHWPGPSPRCARWTTWPPTVVCCSRGQADFADIVIESSTVTSVGGAAAWAVKATNLGYAAVAVTAEVTCLAVEVGPSGGHTHLVDAVTMPMQLGTSAGDAAQESQEVVRSCPTGYTPYAPAFDVTDGDRGRPGVLRGRQRVVLVPSTITTAPPPRSGSAA